MGEPTVHFPGAPVAISVATNVSTGLSRPSLVQEIKSLENAPNSIAQELIVLVWVFRAVLFPRVRLDVLILAIAWEVYAFSILSMVETVNQPCIMREVCCGRGRRI